MNKEENKNTSNINFSHPWSSILWALNVPNDKHKDFKEKFGNTLYINDAKEYKTKAFKDILKMTKEK